MWAPGQHLFEPIFFPSTTVTVFNRNLSKFISQILFAGAAAELARFQHQVLQRFAMKQITQIIKWAQRLYTVLQEKYLSSVKNKYYLWSNIFFQSKCTRTLWGPCILLAQLLMDEIEPILREAWCIFQGVEYKEGESIFLGECTRHLL